MIAQDVFMRPDHVPAVTQHGTRCAHRHTTHKGAFSSLHSLDAVVCWKWTGRHPGNVNAEMCVINGLQDVVESTAEGDELENYIRDPKNPKVHLAQRRQEEPRSSTARIKHQPDPSVPPDKSQQEVAKCNVSCRRSSSAHKPQERCQDHQDN